MCLMRRIETLLGVVRWLQSSLLWLHRLIRCVVIGVDSAMTSLRWVGIPIVACSGLQG